MESGIRVAANALIVEEGRALLVEFDGESGVHLNFPGGGVGPGETLEEAVRREVREEACLDVRVDRLRLIVESIAARDPNRIAGQDIPWNELRFFFLCSPLDAANVARLPDRPDANQTGVRWLPLESLPLEPSCPR